MNTKYLRLFSSLGVCQDYKLLVLNAWGSIHVLNDYFIETTNYTHYAWDYDIIQIVGLAVNPRSTPDNIFYAYSAVHANTTHVTDYSIMMGHLDKHDEHKVFSSLGK